MTRFPLLLGLVCVLWTVGCSAPQPVPPKRAAPTGAVAPRAPSITPFGLAMGSRSPAIAGEPRATTVVTRFQRLENEAYVSGFSNELYSPIWSAWTVPVTGPTFAAPPPMMRRFAFDSRTPVRITEDEYAGSGLSLGHLCPPRSIGAWFGRSAQVETYRTSNAAPMPDLFRVGVWRALETAELEVYARRFGQLWVATGPIFEGAGDGRIARVGIGRLAKPAAFWRVVLEARGDEADATETGGVRVLAMIVPVDARKGERIGRFFTTVDEIERIAGLDLLSALEDDVENAIEAAMPDGAWLPDLRLDSAEIRRGEYYVRDGAGGR